MPTARTATTCVVRVRPPVLAGGERHHVERAALEPDQEQAEQHHDGSEHRVEDELPGGGPASGAAPAGDEEVHRDEDGLEGQEEEHQVELANVARVPASSRRSSATKPLGGRALAGVRK